MDIRIKKSIKIINYIIDDLKLENVKKFSETLGFDRPERIYKILRGQSAISRNLATIINNKFPKYSIEWLLTGSEKKEDEIYFKKEGVSISIKELTPFIAENEEEFLKEKIFYNIVEIRVAKRIAEITSSKDSLLEYLKE